MDTFFPEEEMMFLSIAMVYQLSAAPGRATYCDAEIEISYVTIGGKQMAGEYVLSENKIIISPLALEDSEMRETYVLHVISHCVYVNLSDKWKKKTNKVFSHGPNVYTGTVEEEFAESFALYHLTPDKLSSERRRFFVLLHRKLEPSVLPLRDTIRQW